MRDPKMQSLAIILASVLLVTIPSLSRGQKDVKGFPGIPIYPGADSPQKHPEEPGKDYSGVREDGSYYIWYVFSKQLQKEWDKDAEGVTKKVMDFYMLELKKRDWQYIGEGIGYHHWVKGKDGIAIVIPTDYEIEYTRMSSEDAQANAIKLSDKEFIKAFVESAKAAQKVYEKYGMKTGDDYGKKVFEMSTKSPEELASFDNKLKSDVRKAVKDVLKTFKVSIRRLKELKSEYEEMFQQYIGEHISDYTSNQLGFMAIDEL